MLLLVAELLHETNNRVHNNAGTRYALYEPSEPQPSKDEKRNGKRNVSNLASYEWTKEPTASRERTVNANLVSFVCRFLSILDCALFLRYSDDVVVVVVVVAVFFIVNFRHLATTGANFK